MKKTYTLEFNGYWRDVNKSGLPSHSGIYCVYECTKHDDFIIIHRLIYIGESENIRKRVSTHEKYDEWMKYVKYGRELCFSASEEILVESDRIRMEAACINHHKPPVNVEYKNSFPFDTTTMNLEGDIEKLTKSFIVVRSLPSKGLKQYFW